MTDKQRAAFEAEMRKDLGMPEYVELNWEADYVATAWKYYQAALESPEVQALRDALREYADPNNWEKDEFGWRRIWLEPGSATPESYAGYEFALSALAAMEAGK